MNIFDSMKKKKKDETYQKTNAYIFYQDHKRLIEKVRSTYDFQEEENTGFFLLESNILIKAFITKELIEKAVPSLCSLNEKEKQERMEKIVQDRPFILTENEKIYLPQFPKSLNYIYLHDPEKLLEYPYNLLTKNPSTSCIDFFDVYGYSIFCSNFCSLIFLGNDSTSAAFYDSDFETIYIINDQGRLDLSIPLFDKYLKNKNLENLDERLKEVTSHFFENDRTSFVKSLFDVGFISEKMHRYLLKKISIRRIKKAKVGRKEK